MMVGFTWIQVVLVLMLMLQFTVTGQFNFTVRDGDDVTLTCGNVTHDQDQCDRTDWIFNGRQNTWTVTLVRRGQTEKTQISKSKSDRLSVTEKCSLVIKKVTEEDVGRYTCRRQGSDSEVHLSVVTITGQFTVRDGGDVTLPCGNMRHDQDQCDKTTWMLSGSGNTAAVELVQHGKIKTESKSKSDRLSVTEKCSLGIKKVTEEDVGRYSCRQFEKEGGRQLGSDSVVDLSVVTRTEHKDDDKVTLTCSVRTHGHCGHTVKWLYDHNNNEFKVTETSQSFCSVTVTLTTSELHQKYSDLLTCEVTDGFSINVQQFTFTRPSSGETSGDAATTQSVKSTSTTRNKRDTTTTTTTSLSTTKTATTTQRDWLWWVVSVAVGSAVIVFAIIGWKKRKGKKTGTDENATDPEGGVSYASISYSKKHKHKARNQRDEDEGDIVTYSSLKASSSSAGASTDPQLVYAAINKPKK